MANQNVILEKIQQYINEYSCIYVVARKEHIYAPFFRNISKSIAKKCLLLVAGFEEGCISELGIDIRAISHEEYHEIESLYYLYEFSDRMHFLDDRVQYGSLDNYIADGLLTEKEVFMALLR